MLAGQPRYRQAAIKRRWKQETYQLIHDCHQKYNWKIDLMCKWAKIARSAYYKYFDPKRKPSKREERDKKIEAKIIEITKSNNSLFGTEKMTMAVNRQMSDEKPVYHKTVYRLMCINGIRSQKPRYQKLKFKHTTPEKTAENKLKRDFNASRPNEKWCTDITEVVAANLPKAYLCTVFDLYDRYPVGYAISKRNDTALVQAAYKQAVKAYPNAHPLFHSDRGFQFTRAPFQNQLEDQGMTQSMSRVGCCIDNGPMEGWQGIIKEMRVILHPQVASYDELNDSICKTIDYYINEDPQKRFNGLTAGEMRKEAMKGNIKNCPIAPNHRIEKYWQKIHENKIREAKKSSADY